MAAESLDALIERADLLIGTPCHREASLLAALPENRLALPLDDDDDVFALEYDALGIDLSCRIEDGRMRLFALFLTLTDPPAEGGDATPRRAYRGRLPFDLRREARPDDTLATLKAHALVETVSRHEGTGTVILFARTTTGTALRMGYTADRLVLVTVARPVEPFGY